MARIAERFKYQSPGRDTTTLPSEIPSESGSGKRISRESWTYGTRSWNVWDKDTARQKFKQNYPHNRIGGHGINAII
jgi:hypothetical protein